MNATIIKGAPLHKWESVQVIQDQPFIYVMSNGSRWMGEEAGEIAELLKMLDAYDLDMRRFENGFITVNPCDAAYNPKWTYASPGNVPRYIDGKRLYACDGVVRFFGNFAEYSHVFNIDTNDSETIAALTSAIDRNIARQTAQVQA